ncbi:squalene epoxidase Erg1p [Monosporozyma unispora]|nr:Squalene epoxidase [Kazachstania unispora]
MSLTDADNKITYDAIVIGAGVIGPCVATGLARKGKKVLIVEREWTQPDRIVGELMQPGGVRALRSLGMVQSINNIEAQPVTGYTVMFNGEKVDIPYPYKSDVSPLIKLDDLVHDGNDQVVDDKYITRKDFEDDERERGVAFVHGKFLTNLREIVKREPNVTCLQGNCIEILKSDNNEVIGAKVDVPNRGKVDFKANITFICDGIFSHFRKELNPQHVPTVNSSFVGMALYDTALPTEQHGHVILGNNHMPVIVYKISPNETRILCAYNSAKVTKDIKSWMIKDVQPYLPKELKQAFNTALASGKYRAMPNSYLPAKQNDVIGLCVIGDALNMRHPLTGGGMTVGLNDVVLMLQKIGDLDFNDRATVLDELLDFHYDKKNYDTVINVLSIALYSLFAADSKNLKALQKGCFKYFQRGGDCVNVPVQFLSGLLPSPFQLTKVFFAVAIYSVYLNIEERGFLGLPMALLEGIMILLTAVKVFTPFLLGEMMG